MHAGREHWDRVYEEKAPDEVSWFEFKPTALELIDDLGLEPSAPVVDVGGGASHLAAELLDRGFGDIVVADISEAALAKSREGLESEKVEWRLADVRDHDFGRQFALWHDRAVLHFMVDAASRDAYVRTARNSIRPGGNAIIATFAPDGPTQCSGLPVRRYLADGIASVLGEDFTLRRSMEVEHTTPSGSVQRFVYALLQREDD